MDAKEKGYTQTPMYEEPEDLYVMPDWPPKDRSQTASNHRRRIDRNKYDANTR